MIEAITYHGWNALALRTPELELVAPVDIGPRVVSFRRPGGRNLFFEFAEQRGGRGEPDFRFRGGHRLWHAPEHPVRTYQPDNDPVIVTRRRDGRGFTLAGAAEARTGLAKSLALEEVGPRTVKVTHTLHNHGLWPVECAPWALTMLRRGGHGIVPFLPRGAHPRDLLPTWHLVPWSYTDFTLPSWRWGAGHLAIDTRRAASAQKVGLGDYPGWSAYWIGGDTFVKYASVRPGAVYPDRGCPFETYHDQALLELETLGPLAPIPPGGKAVHVEWWGLLPGLPRPATDRAFRDDLAPAVAEWLRTAR